jgi:hypothetical protein
MRVAETGMIATSVGAWLVCSTAARTLQLVDHICWFFDENMISTAALRV